MDYVTCCHYAILNKIAFVLVCVTICASICVSILARNLYSTGATFETQNRLRNLCIIS